ncbi:MAG TPA: CHRD domain-containing protein [Ilumatobacteraceae bacterium]|nr:CHRD domain-containing protein [Ilumatobacteraceae bacterium]
MNSSRKLFPIVVPGDDGATGSAALTLNQGQDEICFDFELVGLTTPAGRAHIHRGAAGANGGVVVEFYETAEPALTEGCVAVDGALVKEIRKNPAGFYVNVHNSTAPAGAVRGQLGR